MSVKSIQRFLRIEIKRVGHDTKAHILHLNGSLLQCNCKIPFRRYFFFIYLYFIFFLPKESIATVSGRSSAFMERSYNNNDD